MNLPDGQEYDKRIQTFSHFGTSEIHCYRFFRSSILPLTPHPSPIIPLLHLTYPFHTKAFPLLLVLPLLRHDLTVYVAEFLLNGAHLTTTGRGLRRVDDRVAFNHTKPD